MSSEVAGDHLHSIFYMHNSVHDNASDTTYHSSDEGDNSEWMFVAGFVPVSTLGLVANSACLWVWQGDTSASAVTFLFQFLALWDNVFLALALAYSALLHTGLRDPSNLLYLALLFPQLLSVHTTVAIAASRWVAVWRPLHVHRLVTRRRVSVTCAAAVVWCMAIAGVNGCRSRDLLVDGVANIVLYFSLQVVGLIVPLLVLVGFSVSLLWMTYRHHG